MNRRERRAAESDHRRGLIAIMSARRDLAAAERHRDKARTLLASLKEVIGTERAAGRDPMAASEVQALEIAAAIDRYDTEIAEARVNLGIEPPPAPRTVDELIDSHLNDIGLTRP